MTRAAAGAGGNGLRLLQAMAGAPRGGAEKMFVRLALALGRRGVAQRALIRRDPARAAALRAGGVDTVELPFGGRLDLVTRRAFGRQIADFRPTLVLTWMSRATRFCPRGGFVHMARLGGYYDLKYYRRADHLIGNTPDLAEYFVRNGWPRDRSHAIPNFVDDRRAPPRERAALDTPDDAPLVFALGRLHRNKAFDVLLAALARVEGAYLWLAGDGAMRDALEAQARDLGIADRVRFLGWLDDPAPCFAAADLFVLPSRHEPFGNALVEGWAQGLAAVVAESEGPRQLVRHCENGLLVPVDDTEAMAAAIRRLIGDPGLRETLGRGGRAAYEADFTEDIAVQRYLDLFDKICVR